MRKKFVPVLVVSVMLICAGLLISGCGAGNVGPAGKDEPQGEKLKVVASTSLIAEIVQAVGGNRVTVTSIIPPASCPGHFDVKPEDMQVLADARLFMLHNWQGEKFSDDMINSAGNNDLQKVILDVNGNWMVPPVRIEAVDKIVSALSAADPANAGAYNEAATKLKGEAQRVGQEQKNRLVNAGAGQCCVLVNDMQAGFVQWAGFKVAGTYGRAEDLSPKQLQELIELGRKQGVALVIDNLQSGKETGTGIAREIGCKQVTLNNFPGGLPGTDTWADTIAKNADLLIEAMNK